MALPRESHSREIRSTNKSVYEDAVTGIRWSCMLLLIGSCRVIINKEMSSYRGRFEYVGGLVNWSAVFVEAYFVEDEM